MENRTHDSAVRAIQDRLAQVWIVEKTVERNSQEEVRDGAGVGEQHREVFNLTRLSIAKFLYSDDGT
jgi:hypothetical protein